MAEREPSRRADHVGDPLTQRARLAARLAECSPQHLGGVQRVHAAEGSSSTRQAHVLGQARQQTIPEWETRSDPCPGPHEERELATPCQVAQSTSIFLEVLGEFPRRSTAPERLEC